jgi:hypothetical protein
MTEDTRRQHFRGDAINTDTILVAHPGKIGSRPLSQLIDEFGAVSLRIDRLKDEKARLAREIKERDIDYGTYEGTVFKLTLTENTHLDCKLRYDDGKREAEQAKEYAEAYEQEAAAKPH